MRFIDQQRRNVRAQLQDYAFMFASKDASGNWWGHDTDLGKLTPEIEQAEESLLELVVLGRLDLLKLILKYHCRRGSELETFLQKKISEHKNWLALMSQSGEKK